MHEPLPLNLEPVANCQAIKGIPFAPELKFRQILITGPPGSGKSTMNKRLGGWPEEGYIDLSVKGWWKTRPLTMRPREVHLGVPFIGHDAGLVVFEDDWLSAYNELEIDIDRIVLPPVKKSFLNVDWRARYVFEFLLPDATTVFRQRQKRAESGSHRVDNEFTLEQIRRQIEIFARVAGFFHAHAIAVYVRRALEECPMRIAGTD